MTRIAGFRGRTAACWVAITCALGLATVRMTHADGAPGPHAHVDCARSGAGTSAAKIAQRSRTAVESRPASSVRGVARRAPAAARMPGRAGLVVEVDPSADEASPTTAGADSALRAGTDAALARSTEGLELQMLPDGSRRVNLQGRFRAYSVVTIAADGTLTMACADDHTSALGLARSAAPHTPAARASRVAFGPREE